MSIKSIDYKARHNELVKKMGNGALLQLAMPEATRNSDVHHNWRQESLLYWLTGFAEPQSAILILAHKPEGERVHIFLRERNPELELWSGRRLGIKGAEESLCIDKAHPIDDLFKILPKLLDKADKIFYDFSGDADSDKNLVNALNSHRLMMMKNYSSSRLPIHDASWLAGQVRLRKTDDEIDRMRKAAEITSKAFDAIYQEFVLDE